MGRPTEYSEAIYEAAAAYLNEYKTEHEHAMPSVVGLCSVINRARSTVYKWAGEDHPEFSDILDQINEKQQLVLLNKGLTGEFNSAITKLALGKHGYHEKQDINASVKEMTQEEWVESLK